MISIALTDLGLLCIVHFIGQQLFSVRFKLKTFNIMLFCLTYFLLYLANFSGKVSDVSTFLMTFLFFLYLYIQFHSKLFYTILISLVVLIIGYISEFLAALIMNIWSPTLINTISYNCALLISLFINFLFASLFIKILKAILKCELPKYSWGVLILPIFTIFFIYKIGSYYELVNNHKDILFIVFGLFLSNILILYFFYMSIQTIRLKAVLIEEKLKREKMNLKYKLLNQHYQMNFDFLHDLLHRGNELYKYFLENKQEELGKGIEELNLIAFKEFNAIYSNNLALNTVINENLSLIRNLNLEIRTEILSDLSFIPYDVQIDFFTILISTVLDIVEKQRNLSAYLFIRVFKRGSNLLIRTTFSSNEEKGIKDEIIIKCLNKYNVICNHRFNPIEQIIQILVIINLDC